MLGTACCARYQFDIHDGARCDRCCLRSSCGFLPSDRYQLRWTGDARKSMKLLLMRMEGNMVSCDMGITIMLMGLLRLQSDNTPRRRGCDMG